MSRESSERVLGDAADLFAEAMRLTASYIDATAERDDFESLRVKRMLGWAAYSFNLLVSAWDSMLTGRYAAAAGHQRSINETPDILKALYMDPDFADRMRGTKEDIKKARQIVRDAYASDGKPEAKTFIESRRRELQPLHKFSHLTFQAVGIGLGIGIYEGEKIGVIRAGGAPANHSLRAMARVITLDAVELAGVVAVVLADSDLSEGPIKELIARASEAIGDQLDHEEVLGGEMDKILLARSDAEPPSPERVDPVRTEVTR